MVLRAILAIVPTINRNTAAGVLLRTCQMAGTHGVPQGPDLR